MDLMKQSTLFSDQAHLPQVVDNLIVALYRFFNSHVYFFPPVEDTRTEGSRRFSLPGQWVPTKMQRGRGSHRIGQALIILPFFDRND
jgi:hypothetical protein